MFGERTHAVGKTRSAKPTQQFLSAMSKEYYSQYNASYSHDPVSVRTCETLDHRSFSSTANFLPASPTIYTKSRGSLGEKGFDPGHFLFTETQLAGTHHSFGLTSVARADDRSRHGGMVQRPSDCDFSG
jgi:hypothetical protein